MKVATGSYTGNGSSQSRSGLGFQPSFVLLQTVNQSMVWTSSAMGANSSKSMGTGAVFAGAITSLDADGFSVGSSALANANGQTVYYVALGGATNIAVGSYVGNAVDNRNITGLGIDPNFVWVWRSADNPQWRSTSSGQSCIFENVFSGAAQSDSIQALGTDSFQVGTHQHVNSNGVTYYYLALTRETGRFIDLSYAGNGADNRSITGFGFQPTFCFTERVSGGSGSSPSCVRYGAQVGDVSFTITGSSGSDRIQAFQADGIQVGTNDRANASGTYGAFAFADGTSEVGAGSAAITGTAGDGATEGQIVAGAETLIITLTDETWVAAGGGFDAIRQDIIDGIAGSGGDTTDQLKDGIAVTDVVRTADDVVTITLPAIPGYAITSTASYEITVPGSAVVGGSPIVATPTFDVSITAPLDFSLVGTLDLEIELSPGIGVSFLGTLDLEIDIGETPGPPTLDFVFTGSLDLDIELGSQVETFTAVRPGDSHVDVYNQHGVLQGRLTPLNPYKISRYENQVGSWECLLPVDEEIDYDGIPLARKIEYGWMIDITQDNFSPENAPGGGHLLYQGVVEERTFAITEGGQTALALKGSFRTFALVRRSVLHNFEYEGSLRTLTNSLVGTLLDPYGPIYDYTKLGAVRVAGKFNDMSRFAAWARASAQGRYVIRETWDHDRPQLVPYDGPPDSGITFRRLSDLEADDPDERYTHDTGATGVAIISGRPSVRWGGTVVNRIIAVGTDMVTDPEDPEGTVTAELTLASASLSSPYPVKAGLNPDGTSHYYIEDEDSIERYGLTEIKLVFSEVRNPNNLTETRRLAANVLYMKAVNEMIKRRSEKIEVTLPPLANGARIWALPGDSAIFQYHGEVETEAGAAIWMDIDKRFLIAERHEESHGSGIRRVGYKIMAPEMEFPVPGLPGEIVFPPDSPCGDLDSSEPEPASPDCPSPTPPTPPEDDPGTGENEGPDDEWEDNFPPPEAQYVEFARDPLFIIVNSEVTVPWNRRLGGDLFPGATSIDVIVIPDLGAGTWTVTYRLGIRDDGFEPKIWTTRLRRGATVLEEMTFDLSGGDGSNIQYTEDGFPFFPTIGSNVNAGDSIRVTVAPGGGTDGATIGYGGDSRIRISFTPA